MIAEAVRVGMYPHFLPCPGGETVEEVMTRAGEFFDVSTNKSISLIGASYRYSAENGNGILYLQ